MKKSYIAPSADVVEVEAGSIMQASVKMKTEESDGTDALSSEYRTSIWN